MKWTVVWHFFYLLKFMHYLFFFCTLSALQAVTILATMRVKKYLATKILTKVANCWPEIIKNSHLENELMFGQVIESIHTIPLFDMNGKPKMSINWEEAKPYFMYPAEERNLHPPWQRQCAVTRRLQTNLPPQSICWWQNPCLVLTLKKQD